MRFRIDLLLLLAVVVCTWSASQMARQKRERSTRTLTLLESTVGLPFIANRNDAELIAMNSKAKDKLEWHLWIPEGKVFYLCAATHGLTNAVLENYGQYKLMPGRHHVRVDRYKDSVLTYRIRINDTDWSITNPIPAMDHANFEGTRPLLPWSSTIKDRVKLGKVPITVFRTIGKATLAADEKYDPDKHALGLQLWVQP